MLSLPLVSCYSYPCLTQEQSIRSILSRTCHDVHDGNADIGQLVEGSTHFCRRRESIYANEPGFKSSRQTSSDFEFKIRKNVRKLFIMAYIENFPRALWHNLKSCLANKVGSMRWSSNNVRIVAPEQLVNCLQRYQQLYLQLFRNGQEAAVERRCGTA